MNKYKIKLSLIIACIIWIIPITGHATSNGEITSKFNYGFGIDTTVPCSSGFCYNATNIGVGSWYEGNYRYRLFGFRISLVDKSLGTAYGKPQDYIPGLGTNGAHNRFDFPDNNIYYEPDLIYLKNKNDGTKPIKQNYSGSRTNWSQVNLENNNLLEADYSGNFPISANSWYFSTIIDKIRKGNSETSYNNDNQLIISNLIKQLIDNYNNNETNQDKMVLNTGGGTDRNALNTIVEEIAGDGNKAEDILKKNNIQIEMLTRIDLGMKNTQGEWRRYHIIGTAADIYTFAVVSSNQYYESSDLFGRAVSFLFDVNNTFYTTKGMYGYSSLPANMQCHTEDMRKINESRENGEAFSLIDDEYFACGVATIDSLGPSACYIETDDSGNTSYFGKDQNGDSYLIEGTIQGCTADTSEECYKQQFIEDCGCDVAKEKGLDNLDYWQTKCNKQEEPPTCEPIVSHKKCSDGTTFSIGDNLDCVFNVNNVNKNTYDKTSKNYTYQKNEFCSQTCAETIDFDLPGSVLNNKAGTYWIWKDDQIKLTGTRTCQSTVDINKFNNEIGDFSSPNNGIQERLKKIYNNSVTDNKYSEYPLLNRLADIQAAYNEYNAPAISTSTNRVDCGTELLPKHGYCTTETFTSTKTGETFIKKTASGSCNPCGENYPKELTTNNGKTLVSAIQELKSIYNNAVEIVTNKVSSVNECTTSLIKQGNRAYNFNPEVTFNYDDTQYDQLFDGKIFTDTTDTSNNTNYYYTNDLHTVEVKDAKDNLSGWVKTENFTTTKLYYPIGVDVDSTYNNEYYVHSANQTIQQVKKTYRSNVNFYMNITDFNKGILTTNPNSNNYNIGYVYPISLNTPQGTNYSWNLKFNKLGVDMNGQNTRYGRFNKVLNNQPLNYACTYEVINDVTNPTKPNFFYRNISLNNFDPNDREAADTLGKNWTNDKGKKTRCEIEDGKYENGKCNIPTDAEPESIYEEPEYSFTLTPENMQNIKNYNREKEKNGEGYSDFNMTKFDDNALSEGIWYKSDFLSEAVSKKYVQPANESKGYTYKYETKFTKWENSQGKLSGVGPAWK